MFLIGWCIIEKGKKVQRIKLQDFFHEQYESISIGKLRPSPTTAVDMNLNGSILEQW